MPMNIHKGSLSDYREKSGWSYDDKAYVTEDGKYCLFFYNITEVRMQTYLSTFAIFSAQDLERPLVTLEPNVFRTWYSFDKPYFYAPETDLVVTLCCLQNDMPFLLIDPSEQKFALLPFDNTSIYYGLEEKGKGVLELTECYPQELDRSGCQRQTGRIIEANKLKWYDLSRLKDLEKLYKRIKFWSWL